MRLKSKDAFWNEKAAALGVAGIMKEKKKLEWGVVVVNLF